MPLDNSAGSAKSDRHVELISTFINGKISAEEFESAYLPLFKSDRHQVPGPEFDVLERQFFAVDDYVADPQLRKSVHGLGEEELRECAREAYRRLDFP